MSRGAGTCWQQDDSDHSSSDGFHLWLEPPQWPPHDPQPCTESERAQRWRLSLASLLFLTVLLSDHLWFCAEAKLALARTRDRLGPAAHAQTRSAAAQHSPHRGFPHAIFIGNSSSRHLWRLHHTCSQDAACVTSADAEHLCRGLSEEPRDLPERRAATNMSDLYLSFCNSYSLLDLLQGATSPDQLNCSLAVLEDADPRRCSLCVQAYQRYDMHAQEKYEDFELLTQKYEPGPYSVRTCMEHCKTAYKPWLCAQYFPTPQQSCPRTVPCHQYCLEVQQSCPFILPDNDDLIHGGSPSFICTGLFGDHPSDSEAQCCDVRWDPKLDPPSGTTLKRTSSSCQPEGASVTSAAPRPCSGRLKICLLALVLLHTVIIISASQNSSLVGVAAFFSPEESSSNEE
ncbi:transmembrane protein FAM155A-like [Gouania willdenowi]|uniref:Transmembrane protein FAM155A-like n=1 Tax=Gouania willdenowi TaxID=441366 RepID=A0A8C5DPS0_GOUWI|nr:transmembrane protein FAM155A-like [Gouania willdenowi]